MSVNLDSIKTDLFGIAVVLIVLILLSIIVKLIFAAMEKARLNKMNASTEEISQEPLIEQVPSESEQVTQGELKLINIDEKTAALIMAIISHESGIQLAELNFKSIRLLNH